MISSNGDTVFSTVDATWERKTVYPPPAQLEEKIKKSIPKCKGIFGAIFGHNFEARYDEKTELPAIKHINHATPEHILALKNCSKIYKYDICSRCGVIVSKEDN